jgi:hypothetical protein
MKENEFIEDHLGKAREALSVLPKQYARLKREADRSIDMLCEKAGIMDEVQVIRDTLEQQKVRIQSQADKLQGQVAALETLFNRYHLAPIPDGVTHMYGINLLNLDPQTRLKVMHGQGDPTWEETIRVLGGSLPPAIQEPAIQEPTIQEPVVQVQPPRLELSSRPGSAESRDIRSPLPTLEIEDDEDSWEDEEDSEDSEDSEDEKAILDEIEALEEKVSSMEFHSNDLAYLRDLKERWKEMKPE